MRDLPSGTVTFLFSDIEGSTKLLHELGAEGYAEALAEHRRVVRQACAAQGGAEVDTQGDAFFFAFPSAPGAAAAAEAITDALARSRVHVRMGLHTGAPLLTEEGYVGEDVHFAARVGASGHGGQILLSRTTREFLGPEVVLRDLGEHRLKDIPEAVALYQLGVEVFPPLKTISNTNLPRPASSFVGRETELKQIVAEIERGGRLLTLTGPGGSGKTRLALEAATTLVPGYKAGVFWVGLAALRDPALVTAQISHILGAKDGLAEHIGEREMLLLVDNFEQVIEAAPHLSRLLQACPNLTLLCTSRELLRVQGEVEYAVPPLASAEAVNLFCERSKLEPSDEISELCARLDHLPLAVELAAARTKALTPAQILERVSQRLDLLKGGRDADPRQQTLRATIEWSYELLSEEERRLFRFLSVFSGGCTLEAAEEVAGAELDTLQSLVEKSLVRFSNGRYWMLETIREYALERPKRAEEADEGRHRHGLFFLALAEEAAEELEGKQQAIWIERLADEHDNLRLALQHFVMSGSAGLELRLVAAMWNLWFNLGYWEETRRALEHALVCSSGATTERVRVLQGMAWIAWRQDGDVASSRRLGEEALRLSRDLNEGVLAARSLRQLALAAQEEGDHERESDLLKEAARLSRSVGDLRGVGIAANNLAHIPLLAGDYRRAADLFEESLSIAQQLGNELDRAAALLNLGQAELSLHDYRAATTHLSEALALARHIGIREVIVEALYALAAVAAGTDEAERAATLIGAAQGHADFGHVLEEFERRQLEGTVETIRMVLGDEGFEKALGVGRAMSLETAVEYVVGDARSTDAKP
jgi:predicted ATPase